MKITKKAKKNLIIIFSITIFVMLVLLAIIVWQTIKVNKLKSEINSLDVKIEQTNDEIELQNKKISYYESEQFKNDYKKYELGYSEKAGEIYK